MTIDFNAAIQQIKDMAVIDALTSSIPDEDQKTMVQTMLLVFVRHGVPASEAVKITLELADIFKNKEDK